MAMASFLGCCCWIIIKRWGDVVMHFECSRHKQQQQLLLDMHTLTHSLAHYSIGS